MATRDAAQKGEECIVHERSSHQEAASEFCRMVKEWWPLLLGNVLEWYEFSVYGYMAEHMQDNFFSGSRVGTWMGFSVTFLARPLGGIMLGVVGDRFGRRPATFVAVVGMLAATVGQGLLPVVSRQVCDGQTYSAGQLGLYLLILLRFIQGVSAGGEEGSVLALLAESGRPQHKALAAALFPATGFVAFLLSASVAGLLSKALTPHQMACWGWRLPFMAALPPGLVAGWGRARLLESEAFMKEEQRELAQQQNHEEGDQVQELPQLRSDDAAELWRRSQEDNAPRKEDDDDFQEEATEKHQLKSSRAPLYLSNYRYALVIGHVATASWNVMLYTATVWCCDYLKTKGMDHASADLVGVSAHTVQLISVLLFARLGDVVGIGCLAPAASLAAAVAGLPVFAIIQSYPTNLRVAMACISGAFAIITGLLGACMFLFCAELFPTKLRALGIGLTFNLSSTIVGGLSGIMSEALQEATPLGPGIWISACSTVSLLALVWGLRLHSGGHVQLTHIRHKPYFKSPWATHNLSAGACAPTAVPALTPESLQPAIVGAMLLGCGS